MVGSGNCRSYNKYNALTNADHSAENAGENEILTLTINGKKITYGKNVKFNNTMVQITASVVNFLESIKSGGTIGMSVSTGGNEAGMLYGYKSDYINTTKNGYTEKEGLYTTQFLTHTASGKRVLLDGYVGSNGYTSVMCLGVADPWANMYTWVFGMAVLNDTDDPNRGENDAVINIYATTQNYNYKTNNWIVDSYSGTGADSYATKISALNSAGYRKLGYNLPTADGFYSTLGITNSTTQENLKDTLIGLPSAESRTVAGTQGLCDIYAVSSNNKKSQDIFGVIRGKNTEHDNWAGPFSISIVYSLDTSGRSFGLRTTLVG